MAASLPQLTGAGFYDPRESYKALRQGVDWYNNTNFVNADYNPATYNANTSDYQAQLANLSESDYAKAIQQAQGGAFAANGMSTQTAGQQAALAQALQDQAAGKGPSLTQMQLQQATQANAAQYAGAIASQRGINPALAARMVGQNAANMNQQMAGQSAIARLQEQMQARAQLGDVLGQQRAQDIGQMQANTGMFGAAGGLQNNQNSNRVSNMSQMQQINAETARRNAEMQNQAAKDNAAAQNAANQYNSQGTISQIGQVASGAGGAISALAAINQGGEIPGRAKLPGDRLQNDTVPALLSPGEIVIPRSVAQAPDAPEKTAAFVAAIKAKKTTRGHGVSPEEPDYGQTLMAIRQLHGKVQQMERMFYGGVLR